MMVLADTILKCWYWKLAVNIKLLFVAISIGFIIFYCGRLLKQLAAEQCA